MGKEIHIVPSKTSLNSKSSSNCSIQTNAHQGWVFSKQGFGSSVVVEPVIFWIISGTKPKAWFSVQRTQKRKQDQTY